MLCRLLGFNWYEVHSSWRDEHFHESPNNYLSTHAIVCKAQRRKGVTNQGNVSNLAAMAWLIAPGVCPELLQRIAGP